MENRYVNEYESNFVPTKCPVCGNRLEWVGVDLKCTNGLCSNIEQSDLQQWCEIIGKTDGLQWTLMHQYLNKYGVNSINSLYSRKDFILNDLNTKKLSLTEIKVKEFFMKIYVDSISLEQALLALNIPRLGEKTAKLLSKYPDMVIDYYNCCINNASMESISDRLINIVKEATTTSLLDNRNKFARLGYLFSGDNGFRISHSNTTENKSVKYVAVTGSLNSMKRKDFEKYIETYGYELSSNLKKCIYLITNTKDSNSTKSKQAREFGVDIITEEEFFNKLNNL